MELKIQSRSVNTREYESTKYTLEESAAAAGEPSAHGSDCGVWDEEEIK